MGNNWQSSSPPSTRLLSEVCVYYSNR
jgi:hypothetical protein